MLDSRKDQMNLRFQRAGGQLEKTHGIRQTRRDIARIKTQLSAKRITETGGKHVVKAVKKVAAKKSTAAKAAAPKKAKAKSAKKSKAA